MPFLESYIEIKEEINDNDNQIKTYKAKREFLIKEIFTQNNEEKLLKRRIIKDMEKDIKIYDIIERENSILVVIDPDTNISAIFETKIKESNPNLIKESNIHGKNLTLTEIQKLYDYGKKRMCKININNIQESGFFLEIKNNLNLNIPFKRALFTNNHVISEKLLIDKSNINLNYIDKNKSYISKYLNIEEIELFSLQNYNNKNSSNLKRKIFTDEFLDYTCIEIFDNDNIINNISYFHNNINQLENKNYKEDKEDIFVLYYPSQQDLSYSLGQIIQIDNPLIYYSALTEQGSSGSPLIKRDNFRIIGIHFGGIQNNINFTNNIDNILIDINNKVKYINSIKDMVNNLIKEKFIDKNKKYEFSNIKLLKAGKIGNIYQGIIKENKNLALIININLFQFYKNNNSIKELKMIIKIIKYINNNNIINIFIEGNGINFVIKRYKLNFVEFFLKKSKQLDFEEIKNFIIQINDYLKIFRKLNINLNYISYNNILVEEENNKIKYQFLFYYNKIISDKFPILSAPELKIENDYSKCDLWSIGILLYYISMNGKYPFNGVENYSEIEKKIKNGYLIDNLENNYLSDLIIKLLKYKKEERINWIDYFNYNINNNIIKAKNKANSIALIIEVYPDDIGKDIYILNNIDNIGSFELNESNALLYINNEEYKFKKYFNPKEEGLYKIELKLKTKMKDCSYMFYNCQNIIDLNLMDFDSGNVENMSHMFEKCSNLKDIKLYLFDTKNVTNMSYMFSGCEKLIIIDLSYFNTINVTNMSHMFNDCNNLLKVDTNKLKSLWENEKIDLSNLNTKNVTNMSHLFANCSKLKNICFCYVYGEFLFSTKNVKDMSHMFEGCSNLNYIDIKYLETINVTNMSYMFAKCSSIKTLDFIYYYSRFNTENVINMSNMFEDCTNLKDLKFCFKSKKLKNMSHMFANCYELENKFEKDNEEISTDNVEDMNGLFLNCSKLKTINISSFDTKNVKNMNNMFANCFQLEKINLGAFDTGNVLDMSYMFSNCHVLTDLYYRKSSFNTINVKDMSYMFHNCHKLMNLNFPSFDMRNVINMDSMFWNCYNLINIYFKFNSNNVNNMNRLFWNCNNLSNFDLSFCNTENVTNMSGLFCNCNKLTKINLNNFKTNNVIQRMLKI